MSGAQGPILEVHDLVKHYGGVRAVDGISFNAQRGTITGLIGPNGAGKSTALNVIGGLLPPDSGRVLLDGDDVTGEPMHRLARRGVVRTFQMARVFGGLTTIENLLVAAPAQRGETAVGVLGGKRVWGGQEREQLERANDMLTTFGMRDKADEQARNLSGGQKRAVETMRALMARPKLLLLDEPMAGLSPSLSKQLEDLFLELSRDGLSLLLVEHSLDTVERLCSNVVVMAQGKVLGEGRMSELRTRKEVQDAYVIG